MTINNNILALSLTWGGYLNHNEKNYSERRNHGLSLTNLTHCISPSEYYNDYYNNDSFNKINLQLHASSNKVNNPYSFSIKSNTSFSGAVQATLPATPTSLIWTQVKGKFWKCTIPENVTRLKIYFYEEDENNPDYYTIVGVTPGKTYDNMLLEELIYNEGDGWGAIIKNLSSKITWCLYTTGETDVDTGSGILYPDEFYCVYSAKINTHTPDIEDY